MSRISKLERSEVTPDTASLYDKIYAQRGNVPNMFRTMAHRPEIFATMMAHFAAVLNTGTVSTKLKELIIVRTSQLNVTPYCLASHTTLARNLGWSDDQLGHLADWQARADFTPAQDQLLAGVLMKVAGVTVSLIAMGICFYKWSKASQAGQPA